METDPLVIVDTTIRSANEFDKRAEAGECEPIQVDFALRPMIEFLRHDTDRTFATLVISRIEKMNLAVQLSLMRDAVEFAGSSLVLLVVHLLAASLTAVRWDGTGTLANVPPQPTESLKIADCALTNTLMIINSDWQKEQVEALLPVLNEDNQMIRRAAWMALYYCSDPLLASETVTLAVKPGLSDSDPVVRSHAENIVAKTDRLELS